MGSSSRHHLDYGLWSGRWTRSAFAPNDAIDNDKDSKNLQNANSHRIVFRVVWCSRLRLVKRGDAGCRYHFYDHLSVN